ncbi:BolA family transcriptional regulator [Candidatus Pantoea edessiphila]|uniref:DNA-binding transcriptional regulator BolA n=1 Tax=Candidatus Pantoea edessiphila TaxID=2044610 RepID=A0A2P5SZE0_9GAMM|nr:transcriptional regulator BolA [Candidatus Pantoea edessiphila]PPI87704.1 BolA family transcriptional regulator [Candidatus Pantoea edessiphila]
MIREKIEQKLRLAFKPIHLEVHDESYRHNVPAGSESHFKIIIVSNHFKGQRFLIRHRAIYSELASDILGNIHALALHTYTLKEWSVLQYAVPNSPCCNSSKTQIA